MLLWFIVAELIFWAPCIVGTLLAIMINPWFWTVCTVYIAFWTLPLTPAIPLQLGLAYGLKKLAEACRRRHSKKKISEEENRDTTTEKDD